MKTYLFWFYLMLKRMLKKPAYLLFLIVLPILSIAMVRIEKDGDENAGIAVGIMFDEETKEELTAVSEDNSEWSRQFLDFLSEQDSILQFQLYEKSAAFFQDIEKGELDCGVILPMDMKDRLMADTWQDSLTICKTSSSTMTEIVKERVACAMFTFYAEESYVNYVENTDIFAQAENNGTDRAEISKFAKEAYETHLIDGSTFAFQYHGESYHEKQVNDSEQPLFRLKGVLAICIFLSGLCGLLIDFGDRQERRFVRIAPEWVTTAVNIWVPTIYTSVATLLSLLLTGQFAGEGSIFVGIGKELCRLVFYQFLIVVYCSIIRLIIRKQELAAAAIPILTLASIVCCPVWIRLAAYLPVFHVLEKLFPVTYYLML